MLATPKPKAVIPCDTSSGAKFSGVANQGTYTNAKLSRSVSLSNVELVKYYNADTSAITHSRLDLQA